MSDVRAELASLPPLERDAWVDRWLGITEVADDGPSLPAGGVPYLPCAIDALLRAIDVARICADDVFVDLGAGAGRTAVVVRRLTGARVIGVEIQPELAQAARALVARLALTEIEFVVADAAAPPDAWSEGTVFFLYCPFAGARLDRVLAHLEVIARARPIRLLTVDLPLPKRAWLVREELPYGDVALHRSVRHA